MKHVSSSTTTIMTPGRPFKNDGNIVFKNNKTGKVEQIGSSDMDLVCGLLGIATILEKCFAVSVLLGIERTKRIQLQNSLSQITNWTSHAVIKRSYHRAVGTGAQYILIGPCCVLMCFVTSFEIPLNQMSQCTTGKNEVTLEFHQNDDAPVSLLEMRFHIPITKTKTDMPIQWMHFIKMRNSLPYTAVSIS